LSKAKDCIRLKGILRLPHRRERYLVFSAKENTGKGSQEKETYGRNPMEKGSFLYSEQLKKSCDTRGENESQYSRESHTDGPFQKEESAKAQIYERMKQRLLLPE